MARAAKGRKATAYRSVGTTTDGVRVLKPKTKSQFSSAQIRAAINLLESAAEKKPVTKPAAFVERAEDGSFTVKRPGKKRASAKRPTQKEAIERGKELVPGATVVAKRVRRREGEKRGTWRKV